MTFLHFYDKPFNVNILRARIQKSIFCKSSQLPAIVITDAINSCKRLFNQSLIHQSVPKDYAKTIINSRSNIKSLYHDLIFHQTVQNSLFYNDNIKSKPLILKALFNGPLILEFDEILSILKSYVRFKNGELLQDDLEAIYILVRNRLQSRQIFHALDVVDASVGSAAFQSSSRYKWLLRGSVGCLGIFACQLPMFWFVPSEIFYLYMSLFWGLATYLITKASKGTTERLRFISQNIFGNLTKQEQLIMINRIIEEYDERFSLNVRNYHYSSKILPYDHNLDIQLRRALVLRGFELKPLNEHSMYQEYWQTAGNGYMWVEPDQDPAILKHKD